MKRYVEIFAPCYEYSSDKAEAKSITVGELMEILRDVDPDEKIVLTNSGYVTIYGPLTYDHITEHGAMDDEDEDEDEDW